MKSYDVVVLGAGPGGYVAAVRASQLGLSTAIVEKRFWGGVCLNVGCIPSKALLRNAELVRLFRDDAARFGIHVAGEIQFDYGAAFRRSRAVADARARGVRFLMRKNQVDSHQGWATLTSPTTLDVAADAGGAETLQFRHLILATGAVPRLLPGTRLGPRVVSYEEQILASDLPRRLVIVGGGPIGVEFADVMNAYGVSVTLVEMADRLLPLEDAEISAELQRQYTRHGIRSLTGARVEAIVESADGVRVHVRSEAAAAPEVLEADRVLQAIGFRPRTEGYGLERTGVALDPRGAIAISDRMQTNVPHIYAIGDVTGKLMLAHVAEAMALVAVEHLAGRPTHGLDYAMMPRATYASPQVASFGWTEAQARERGHDVVVARFPFQANGKAHGLGDASGFVKLISDRRYGELLGAHLIGPDVTELLPELTLAQKCELTAEELARNVHAHPTLGEAVKDAAHGLVGPMLNL